MKPLYFILIGLLVLGSSCSKEDCPFSENTVNGVLVDVTTNAPISGAEVKLMKAGRNYLSSGISYTELQSVVTDSDGDFNFSFCEDIEDLYLEAYHTKYHSRVNNVNDIRSPLSDVSSGNGLLKMSPHAELLVHVRDTSGLYREINLWVFEEGINLVSQGSESTSDETISMTLDGNTESTLGIRETIFNNNVATYVYDSLVIYCPAFETTEVTIEY